MTFIASLKTYYLWGNFMSIIKKEKGIDIALDVENVSTVINLAKQLRA